MIYMNKRGLSPIIATILLIAFAVALGAVAMNWKPNIDCSADVQLKFVEVEGKPLLCASENGIEMTLESLAEKDIIGVKVTVVGEKEVYNGNVNQTLIHAEAKRLNFPFNRGSYGTPKKIKLLPIVMGSKDVTICTANALEFEPIAQC